MNVWKLQHPIGTLTGYAEIRVSFGKNDKPTVLDHWIEDEIRARKEQIKDDRQKQWLMQLEKGDCFDVNDPASSVKNEFEASPAEEQLIFAYALLFGSQYIVNVGSAKDGSLFRNVMLFETTKAEVEMCYDSRTNKPLWIDAKQDLKGDFNGDAEGLTNWIDIYGKDITIQSDVSRYPIEGNYPVDAWKSIEEHVDLVDFGMEADTGRWCYGATIDNKHGKYAGPVHDTLFIKQADYRTLGILPGDVPGVRKAAYGPAGKAKRCGNLGIE